MRLVRSEYQLTLETETEKLKTKTQKSDFSRVETATLDQHYMFTRVPIPAAVFDRIHLAKGLLHPHEQHLMETVYDGDQREQQHKLCQQFNKHWVPFNWLCQLCYHLRERGKIASDPLLGHLLREVNAFRERLQNLSNFDLVPIPLVYPQVVFISVRTYFLLCLFSRQNILSAETLTIKENEKHSTNFVELFFPVMTILQFIFYMGWTKVAEALLNPISMLLADQCHGQVPEQMDGSPVFSDRIRAETVINALIGSAVRTMPTKAKDGQQKSGDAVPKRRSKWTNKNLVERVRKSKE